MSNQSHPSGAGLKFSRSVRYSEELVQSMCRSISLNGLSDAQAGLLAGATPESVAQWKKEKPPFARRLLHARAVYVEERLAKIREAAGRQGAIDWRAQVWLAEHTGATTSGEDEAVQASAAPTISPLFEVTPEQLVLLQKRRAMALEKMNHE